MFAKKKNYRLTLVVLRKEISLHLLKILILLLEIAQICYYLNFKTQKSEKYYYLAITKTKKIVLCVLFLMYSTPSLPKKASDSIIVVGLAPKQAFILAMP